MSDIAPIPLVASPVQLESREFHAITSWPFPDSFVSRLLASDIPQRMQSNGCRCWIYRDPEGREVGFGTLDLCGEYRALTGSEIHPYLPLLAVNPKIKSLGYGTSIVRHLTDQAALTAFQSQCHDYLFLDVYTENAKAISLYTRCGFTPVSEERIPDPNENGKAYIVMAKRVLLSP